jgi:hypothetical protein
MEITSGTLASEQMWEELKYLTRTLSASGYSEIAVYWGWGCELPIDDLWKTEVIPVARLIEHAERGAGAGLFRMGSGDLFVVAPDKTFKFQFCHDSDLHFETSRDDLFRSLRDRWIERRFAGYDRVDEKSWTPFAWSAT